MLISIDSMMLTSSKTKEPPPGSFLCRIEQRCYDATMTKRDGELKKMSSLFALYKDRLKAPQKSVIDASVEVIHDLTTIKLNPARCTYTVATRTFASNAPALIRQELARHEHEIVAHLKARLGEKSAPHRIT